jgi:hypothetical protein
MPVVVVDGAAPGSATSACASHFSTPDEATFHTGFVCEVLAPLEVVDRGNAGT